jgi:hypothetical protein
MMNIKLGAGTVEATSRIALLFRIFKNDGAPCGSGFTPLVEMNGSGQSSYQHGGYALTPAQLKVFKLWQILKV